MDMQKWQDFFTVREFEKLVCCLNSLIFLSSRSNFKTFLNSFKIKQCADKVYNSIKEPYHTYMGI